MIKRKSRPKPITDERAKERREYRKKIEAYLLAHPFDQVKIAICGFDEQEVIAHGIGLNRFNAQGIFFQGQLIRCSNQIHHRNKCRRARLLDERWWMATARESHDYIENHLTWARAEGYSLPIQADAEGKWGAGNQALETPDLMLSKLR